MLELSSKNIKAIQAICESLIESGHKNRSGGANCVKASEVVAPLLGGQLILVDVSSPVTGQKIGIEHGCVVLDDGTIVDPTIKQFQSKFPEGWPGYDDIAVIQRTASLYQYFQVNRKAMMEHQMAQRSMGF